MESSDTREPSYYEVALTNRQVLVAFVVILATLLGAFLSGIWIGRGAGPARPTSTVASAAEPAPGEEPVEQLTFFAQGPPAPGAAASEAPKPAADPATETMRRTLEAEMAANRETPKPAAAPPAPAKAAAAEPAAAVPTAPGSRTRRRQKPEPEGAGATKAPAAAKPAPTTGAGPAATAVAAGATWVQVYSSTNGERAREIAGQLRRAGFDVVVAELPREGKSNWRVRVGPFATRDAADTAATRLRREHSLDTWVTDSP